VLDWDSRNEPAARKRLALVRDLLTVRTREIMPRLAGAVFGEAHAADNGLLTASWRMGDGATLSLLANLSDRAIAQPVDAPRGTLIWGNELNGDLPPWSVFSRIG
jgi:maltooligosyltrehalose trehalohydrolase